MCSLPIIITTVICSLVGIVKSQACSTYNTSSSCNVSSICSWYNANTINITSDDYCRCTSSTPLDILFAIDGSGSVGDVGFQQTKQWIENVVTKEISISNSRMGFIIFASTVNESQPIRSWNDADLIQYVRGITWPRGITATGPAISAAIQEFKNKYNSNREQLFIIITDGNPYNQIDGEHSVCEYEPHLKSAGIQTAMIGVGDALRKEYVECVADYYFNAVSYSQLNGVGLADILCPNTSLPEISKSNVTAGITLISADTTWNDDFVYDNSNGINNQFGGINWYSSTDNGALSGTVDSPQFGELHGWFAYCSGDCANSQINRDFACDKYNDYDRYLMRISLVGYIGCVTDSNNGLRYNRYKQSEGAELIEINILTANETVTETSNKSPCTGTSSIKRGIIYNQFYVNALETISISIWIDLSSSTTNGVVAFGNFTILCQPKTYDPTTDPTTHPTHDPTVDPTYDPTFIPTIDPTYDPTMDPTNDPTTDPTYNPTIDPTNDPTIDPTNDPSIDPTNHPTLTPTNPTLNPSNTPTDGTSNPTINPTFMPTKNTYSPTSLPTDAPTKLPTNNPTKNTLNPSNIPTQTPTTLIPTISISTASPTWKYSGLLFICHYNDNDVDYYTLYITLLQYAQIMIQQILDTINSIDAYSANYDNGEINIDSEWKRGGIIDFKMCSIFNSKQLDIDCSSSYDMNINTKTVNSEYTAIGIFNIVANSNINLYKKHIIQLITNTNFKNEFNQKMNDALNNIDENRRIRRRRRQLLQNAFIAISIEIIDTENISTTQYAINNGTETSDTSTIIIVVIIILIFIVIIGIAFCFYYRYYKIKGDTEGNSKVIQKQIEMNDVEPIYNKQHTNNNEEGLTPMTGNILDNSNKNIINIQQNDDDDIINDINDINSTPLNDGNFDDDDDILNAINETNGGPLHDENYEICQPPQAFHATPGSLPRPPARMQPQNNNNNENEEENRLNQQDDIGNVTVPPPFPNYD